MLYTYRITLYSKNTKEREVHTIGRHLSKSKLLEHKDAAIKKLNAYISSLIENPDEGTRGKSDKLSYWIEDWTTYLNFENSFSPKSLRRYKRGEIIKAHLGYNVGSEEGGLHYCIVIEKNNSINSPVVTIVPLTSVKRKTDITKLRKGEVYLGNELFTNLNSKISYTEKNVKTKILELNESLDSINNGTYSDSFDSLICKLEECENQANLLDRMKAEVSKMKIGSIALTGQIRTISKIRIYDPKTNYDILSNVKLSSDKLDLIDKEIISNFTGCK